MAFVTRALAVVQPAHTSTCSWVIADAFLPHPDHARNSSCMPKRKAFTRIAMLASISCIQDELKKRGLPISGLKAALAERLLEAVTKEAGSKVRHGQAVPNATMQQCCMGARALVRMTWLVGYNLAPWPWGSQSRAVVVGSRCTCAAPEPVQPSSTPTNNEWPFPCAGGCCGC